MCCDTYIVNVVAFSEQGCDEDCPVCSAGGGTRHHIVGVQTLTEHRLLQGRHEKQHGGGKAQHIGGPGRVCSGETAEEKQRRGVDREGWEGWLAQGRQRRIHCREPHSSARVHSSAHWLRKMAKGFKEPACGEGG